LHKEQYHVQVIKRRAEVSTLRTAGHVLQDRCEANICATLSTLQKPPSPITFPTEYPGSAAVCDSSSSEPSSILASIFPKVEEGGVPPLPTLEPRPTDADLGSVVECGVAGEVPCL
jgi:hypothetical protein